MKRFTLFLLTLLLALGLALTPGLARADQDDGDERPQDNLALVANTTDDSSRSRTRSEIRTETGDVVDNQNAAVAAASCERCRTVAIATQVAVVSGTPSEVTPVNLALALNVECTSCETFASAYQFVVGGGGPWHLTDYGRHRIHELQLEARSLGRSELSFVDLQQQLDVLMDEVQYILDTELREGEGDGDDDDGGDHSSADATVTKIKTTQISRGETTTTKGPFTTTTR
jgi:putative peptide zinc metalloprotease protein